MTANLLQLWDGVPTKMALSGTSTLSENYAYSDRIVQTSVENPKVPREDKYVRVQVIIYSLVSYVP